MDRSISPEILFEYATEDISALFWAVDTWPKRGEEYSASYIFTKAVVSFARCRRALERLAVFESDAEYAPYVGKLRKKFKEGKRALYSLAEQQKEEITRLFKEEGEFPQRLHSLETLLSDIKDMAEDGMLLRDEDWSSKGLEEAARDFILIFTEWHELAQNCPENIAQEKEFKSWKKALTDLEQRLKKIYGLFTPVSSFIESLSEREYHLDFWWLSEAPEKFPVADQELTEQDLLKLGRYPRAASPESCPAEELVISYALGELVGKARKEVESHLVKCASCMKMALDVGYASEAADDHNAPVTITDIIDQISRYPVKLPPGSIVEDISGQLTNIVDFILWCEPEPEMLPMAAREPEERGERNIFAFLATVDRGKLLELDVIEVTILDIDFDEERSLLTCNLKLPEKIWKEPSRYKVKGLWIRHDGKVSWPDWRFKRDRKHPQFVTMEFWLPRTEVKDSQLKLVILSNQPED